MTLREQALWSPDRRATPPWTRKHLATLTMLYGRRPYFRSQVQPRLEGFYAEAAKEQGPGSLLRTLLASMALFHEPLGLKPRVVLASTLDRGHPDKTERLASYCTQPGMDTYYSAVGSLYLRPGPFRDEGVRLLWQSTQVARAQPLGSLRDMRRWAVRASPVQARC